jgi:hypothetical protein
MRPMALRLRICELDRHRPCGADRLVVRYEPTARIMRQPPCTAVTCRPAEPRDPQTRWAAWNAGELASRS